MNLTEFEWVFHLVKAIVIMIVTIAITKVTNEFFEKTKLKDAIHIKFLKNLSIGVEYFVGISFALSSFDSLQSIASTVLKGSGLVAIIIGLAAQESFSNIFSGVFICIFKPYDIGDKICIIGDNDSGFVEDITLRHTVIRTYTNVRLIIPNSVMGKSKIENMSYSEGASYPIEITIAYENKEKRYRAMEIMEEVVKGHPLFFEDKVDSVKALCVGYEDSGIKLKVLMWTATVTENAVACSECRMQILDRFEQENIEVPYNKVQILKN